MRGKAHYRVRGVHCGICFFFSSRRRHTRFDCDWSSDVCSSDLPCFRSLVREPGDQVHIDVANSGCAQGGDIAQCLLRGMQPANRFDLLIDKRLRAEAYAVGAGFEKSIQNLRTQGSRSTFHGDLCIGFLSVMVPECKEEEGEVVWISGCGGGVAR